MLVPVPCCFRDFPTQEKRHDHISCYQRELSSTLARLHELLAHRGLETDGISTSGNHDVENEYESRESDLETADEDDGTLQTEQDHGCPDYLRSFKRTQELTRHYYTHHECNVFCRFCSNTFTKPKKYRYHKCSDSGPIAQQLEVKKWYKDLRGDIKGLLAEKLITEAVKPGERKRKRPRIAHAADAPVNLAQASPRPDAASAELDGSDQSTSANFDSLCQPQPQPFLPPSVFSDPNWESMAAPNPLWSAIYPFWENTSVPDTHGGYRDAVVPT